MWQILLVIAWAAFGFVSAFGQKLEIEVDTQEGRLLQRIDAEKDLPKRLALLESFAQQFPNHEAATWVLGHMQRQYLEDKQYDKVFESGLTVLSVDPMELSAAHYCLRAAEARKDLPLIKLWSSQTSQLARKVLQLKRPEYGDNEQVAEWQQKVEFARQVEQYTEYALYFASLQTMDMRVKSGLIEALEQRNPTSEYLAQMRTSHSAVVRQVDIEEAVAAAEAQFQKGEWNEDLLLMAATHYMQKRVETPKIIAYSERILEIMKTKTKPTDLSDADWDTRQRNMIGMSNWMLGLLFSTQEKFAASDKHLRASLPYIKDSERLAGAYYHLGYVNYRLAEAGERIRVHDAIKFTELCIGINSAVQAQAAENLKAIKAEYGLQ